MRRIILFLSLILNLSALSATVWIVVPALSYELWLVSVLASEWSLGFAALALSGIALAVFARILGAKRFWLWSSAIGAVAILIAFYPVASAFSEARAHNVSLSAARYLQGFWNSQSSPEKIDGEFTTRTFAIVDGVELRLDAYQPSTEIVNKKAAIVVVHGGSWSGGARNDFPEWISARTSAPSRRFTRRPIYCGRMTIRRINLLSTVRRRSNDLSAATRANPPRRANVSGSRRQLYMLRRPPRQLC